MFYTPNTSTLYIRSYQPQNQEKQHRKVSLKIKLKNTDIKAYFDERKQRFKDIKKNPLAQNWNDKIESELSEYSINAIGLLAMNVRKYRHTFPQKI